MITVITGTPGAGKTALAVDLLLREYADRPLYVDGLEGLKVEHQPLDVTKWHEEVPDGSVVIVDEVQRKWRPAGPGSKVPPDISALETHRHRGIDFILITQNVKLIHTNVRALSGRHLHIRDTGWMGRWLYEFPEVDPANSWRRCDNKRRYKLPKHVFDKYTSASMHIAPVRNRPLLLYVAAALVIGCLSMLAMLAHSLTSSPATEVPAPPTVTSSRPAPDAQAPAGFFSVATPSAPAASSGIKLIDDRIDWIPRISHMPESAPAFDGIRQVQQMPVVAGGVCMAGGCRCFTQQGTDAGLSDQECAEAIAKPRFDAYSAPAPVQQAEAPPKPVELQELPPEVRHAVVTARHTDAAEVTKAARTARLLETGSL